MGNAHMTRQGRSVTRETAPRFGFGFSEGVVNTRPLPLSHHHPPMGREHPACPGSVCDGGKESRVSTPTPKVGSDGDAASRCVSPRCSRERASAGNHPDRACEHSTTQHGRTFHDRTDRHDSQELPKPTEPARTTGKTNTMGVGEGNEEKKTLLTPFMNLRLQPALHRRNMVL